MKTYLFSVLSLLLLFNQCTSRNENTTIPVTSENQLPKVLFITSGIIENESRLAQGITIALQTFNKMGVMVRLEPRDVLYRFQDMSKYNIIILSTFTGYHDADRKYSLSYMSDEEVHNLTKFVAQGGIIIAADNVARNYPDGTDRIILFEKLTTDNWELSKCLGFSLSEKNMTGFNLQVNIPDYLNWEVSQDLLSEDNELWTLVPEEFSSNSFIQLGSWEKEGSLLPAVIENHYEKGTAYYLAFSGLLHPKNDGGFWSEDQISGFYRYVVDNYNKSSGISFSLNPWPNGFDYAFCVTLNAEGSLSQYNRINQLLESEKINPTFFVNGNINDEVKEALKKWDISLASNGYSYINFRELNYPLAVDDILRNENHWNIKFQGFRFPFTQPGFWGLLALNEQNYIYESSIGANNLEFFHGSVAPFNLVIANNGFTKSTEIMELAPVYHDDYHFLKFVKEDQNPGSMQLGRNVLIYRKYLENYWNYAVKPYNGLMVYMGHPQYVGFSDTTLSVLRYIIGEVKKDNTWITTISEVADFRSNLGSLRFHCQNSSGKQVIAIEAPDNLIVKDVTLNFTKELEKVSAGKGKVKLIENSHNTKVIFDAFKGQTLEIQFK